MVFQAIPGGPAFQLARGTTAEFQQLLPVFLKEIQDSGNAGLLLPVIQAEGRPAHMDMEAAGPGLMTPIVHSDRLAQDCFPRHILLMEIQSHGVRHDFKTFVQRTVVLAINQIFPGICQSQNCFGVSRVFPGSVNLQFHAKISGSVPVEDRLRLI